MYQNDRNKILWHVKEAIRIFILEFHKKLTGKARPFFFPQKELLGVKENMDV